ncbi:hypothetical protein NE237_030561 [Protea cynaroides]|uniref:Uncharacterized protein n=1 Tax=Protea cynaroides TaxID=273540 RepID=A0A9Q0GUB8_9MAGN|nr:hypothetical protein NE237_030561 [Protea cynaroides]
MRHGLWNSRMFILVSMLFGLSVILFFGILFIHPTDDLSAVARTFIPVMLIIKCHVSSRCIIMDFVLILYVSFLILPVLSFLGFIIPYLAATTELLRIFSCNLYSVSINNQHLNTWISLLGKLFRLFICFCELVVLWEVQVLYARNLGLA